MPVENGSPSPGDPREVEPTGSVGEASGPGPGWVLPALLSLAVLLLLRPDLLVSTTLPSGHDLGVHVLPLREMSERLLPSGRIQGWSHAWFAGVPLYYFYFPLPAVLVGLLDLILPFTVAVKIIALAGVLLTPPAAWVLARGLGMRGWPAGVLAVGAGLFLFQESHVHLGGNVQAALAGEFSYALGFALALAYLGVVAASAARDGPQRRGTAAVLLAACALSHVITAGAAVLGALPLLARREARQTVLFSWAAGFLVSAVWSVPFLVRQGRMPDVPWSEPVLLMDWFPVELWPLLPAAAAGAWMSRRAGWRGVALWSAMASAFPLVLLAPAGGSPLRLLPFWHLGLHLLAAWPLAVVATRRGGSLSRTPGLAVAAILSVAGLLTVQAVRSPGELREWARWDFEGFEAKPRWHELRTLTDAVAGLPPGRVYWEDHPYIAGWGTPHAPALLPFWSPDHPVLGGLWTPFQPTAAALVARRETSLQLHTEQWYAPPDVTIGDVARGMEHLRILGVRWFIAFSEPVARAALAVEGARLAVRLPFALVVELPGPGLVTAGDAPVQVWDGDGDFTDAAHTWFLTASPSSPWMAEGGPPEWTRTAEATARPPGAGPSVGAGAPAPDSSEGARAPAPDSPVDSGVPAPDSAVDSGVSAPDSAVDSGVSASDSAVPADAASADGPVHDVVLGTEEIRFRTAAVGVPHLVRVSWFPNWRAEGAEGPWRAAPSFMVVVPTRTEVVLTFGPTWVERVGTAMTLLGLLAVGGVALSGARRRGRP